MNVKGLETSHNELVKLCRKIEPYQDEVDAF